MFPCLEHLYRFVIPLIEVGVYLQGWMMERKDHIMLTYRLKRVVTKITESLHMNMSLLCLCFKSRERFGLPTLLNYETQIGNKREKGAMKALSTYYSCKKRAKTERKRRHDVMQRK